jgi:DNA-binding response OmpR family regulator
VVVATSEQDDGAEIQLIEAGADDYVRKPVDPTRLVARIRATLRRAA